MIKFAERLDAKMEFLTQKYSIGAAELIDALNQVTDKLSLLARELDDLAELVSPALYYPHKQIKSKFLDVYYEKIRTMIPDERRQEAEKIMRYINTEYKKLTDRHTQIYMKRIRSDKKLGQTPEEIMLQGIFNYGPEEQRTYLYPKPHKPTLDYYDMRRERYEDNELVKYQGQFGARGNDMQSYYDYVYDKQDQRDE